MADPMTDALGRIIEADDEPRHAIAGLSDAVLPSWRPAAPNVVLPPANPGQGVPTSITPLQGRRILSRMPSRMMYGKSLLWDVERYFEGKEESEAYQIWEYATVWLRDDILIRMMASLFDLSDTDVDALFMAASRIV